MADNALNPELRHQTMRWMQKKVEEQRGQIINLRCFAEHMMEQLQQKEAEYMKLQDENRKLRQRAAAQSEGAQVAFAWVDVPVSSIITQPESYFMSTSGGSDDSAEVATNQEISRKPSKKSKNDEEEMESVPYEEIE